MAEEADRAANAVFDAWRRLLTNSDNDLGIDGEYTRPGVMAKVGELHDKMVDIVMHVNWL